jgi:hypothetical protein
LFLLRGAHSTHLLHLRLRLLLLPLLLLHLHLRMRTPGVQEEY